MLVAIGVVVVVLMIVGAEATKGVAGWLRVTSSLVPLVLILGAPLTYFLLAACGLADDLSPERAAMCATTSALAMPLALAYSGTAGIPWLCAVIGRGGRHVQATLLKISGVTAVGVPAVTLGTLIMLHGLAPGP